MDTEETFAGNLARFTGFADAYDKFRPSPPAGLATLLAGYAGMSQLEIVVDLGSGTGLSSRYWAQRADQVIGIEPTDDMRVQAARASPLFRNLIFRAGWSHATGLGTSCADIVCCSQALHWMEPNGTFSEAKRILRAGGVFAAVDYDWPPSVGSWEAERAYQRCLEQVQAMEKKRGTARRLQFWKKESHLDRMRESGCFRYVREVLLDHRESGNADRLVGVLLSQGSVQDLLKLGLTEEELGLPAFRTAARHHLGSTPGTWHWSAQVRLGVT